MWIGGIITVITITASTSNADDESSGWIALPILAMFAFYVACAVLAIIGAVRAGATPVVALPDPHPVRSQLEP